MQVTLAGAAAAALPAHAESFSMSCHKRVVLFFSVMLASETARCCLKGHVKFVLICLGCNLDSWSQCNNVVMGFQVKRNIAPDLSGARHNAPACSLRL